MFKVKYLDAFMAAFLLTIRVKAPQLFWQILFCYVYCRVLLKVFRWNERMANGGNLTK